MSYEQRLATWVTTPLEKVTLRRWILDLLWGNSVQTVQSCPTHLSQLRGLSNKHGRSSECHVTDFSSQHVHIGKMNQSVINGFFFTREGPTLSQSQYSYVFDSIFIILEVTYWYHFLTFFYVHFCCFVYFFLFSSVSWSVRISFPFFQICWFISIYSKNFCSSVLPWATKLRIALNT